MNLEIVIYIVVMAILLLYLNWRESSGFLWVCIYVLLLAIIDSFPEINFGYAIVAVGTGIGILFEILSYLGKDPFSMIGLADLLERLIKCIGFVLKKSGVRARTKIHNAQDSADSIKAIRYLQNRQWDELDLFLRSLDPDDRYRVIQAIVDVRYRPKAFDEWLEASPQSALAHIVSGMQLIHWGWEARGGGLGDMVSDKNAVLFLERLTLAQEQLMRAIDLENRFSDAYVGLMTIAMGTGFGREEIWSYFAKALVHGKDHYQAHRQMINAVAEKWGGEPGEMFIVAHQAMANAKPGSPLAGILAEAHIEQWLYLQMCDMDQEAKLYFREKDVRDDLRNVYENIRHCDATSSEMVGALNNFAFCFYLADLNDLAKEVIGKLDGQFWEHPWDYLGNSFLAYIDTAFAIDKVLEQLKVVASDLPDIVVQRSLSKTETNNDNGDGSQLPLSNVAEHYNRRVFKTPIIVPLSVAMVILIYVGYPVLNLMGDAPGILQQLKSITFELFILCEVGLMALLFSSKKHLVNFLERFPAIHNEESLDALKVIARTNMLSALLAFAFLGVGSLMAIMTLVNYGWGVRIVVVILSITTAIVCNLYSNYEERVKQIECLDSKLDEELSNVIDCWMNKAFPNF